MGRIVLTWCYVAYGHPFHGNRSTSWMYLKSHENGVQGNPTIWELPSGKHTKSYWKWPFIVSFPIKKWWFPIVMLVYQRVFQFLTIAIYECRWDNHKLDTMGIFHDEDQTTGMIFGFPIKKNQQSHCKVPCWQGNKNYQPNPSAELAWYFEAPDFFCVGDHLPPTSNTEVRKKSTIQVAPRISEKLQSSPSGDGSKPYPPGEHQNSW